MRRSTPNVQGDRGSDARSREGFEPRAPNAETRVAIEEADRMVAERSVRSEDGNELIESAHEALAIAEGKAAPAGVYVPPTVDVASIRKRLGLTQAAFANRFGVPVRTLRDWEQGRRTPEGPARSLLIVIDREPEAVERALAESGPSGRPAGQSGEDHG